MATIKAYTDLEQSKKLAEILPIESADMYFTGHQSIIKPKEWEYENVPKIKGKYISFDDKRIFYPCWSLAALLSILPYPLLSELSNKIWKCVCYPSGICYYVTADSPIDACYEMIIKLNELKML